MASMPRREALAMNLTTLPVIGWARRWKPLEFPGAWVFAFVIATLFYSVVFWPMIRAGLPWLSATLVGTPHTERVQMHTQWDRGVRALCHYKLLGGPLPDAPFPGHYLCITQAQYLQAPDAPVRVTLSGLRTSLGMRVTSIDAIKIRPDGARHP